MCCVGTTHLFLLAAARIRPDVSEPGLSSASRSRRRSEQAHPFRTSTLHRIAVGRHSHTLFDQRGSDYLFGREHAPEFLCMVKDTSRMVKCQPQLVQQITSKIVYGNITIYRCSEKKGDHQRCTADSADSAGVSAPGSRTTGRVGPLRGCSVKGRALASSAGSQGRDSVLEDPSAVGSGVLQSPRR